MRSLRRNFIHRTARSLRILVVFLALFPGTSSILKAQWQGNPLDESDMAKDLSEALTFTRYPSYPQYVEMMHYFREEHPEICRMDTIGTSAEGRLLLALKISDQVNNEEAEAKFLYTSTIHGDEPLGMVLLLRFASFLLEGYGQDTEVTRLVDGLSIWINPLANPDGAYGNGGDSTLAGATRTNANGVDLNRDFPEPERDAATDTSGRAPETRAMMAFLQEHRFSMSANLHGGAEVVNYPWDHTYALHMDDAWFRFVSGEYADEARAVDPEYMALFPGGITNGAEWYPVQGGRQDYVTWFLAGREVTLELSNEKQVGSERLEEYWEKNSRSLLNYLAQCTYGINGTVSDAETGDPVEAWISLPGHDSSYSRVRSSPVHGDFYRPAKEGTYDVVAEASGYLNDTISAVQVTDYALVTLAFQMEKDGKTGIADPGTADPEAGGFRIYPNPFRDLLMVHPEGSPRGEVLVQVWSVTGKLVETIPATYTGSPLAFSLGHLKQGAYVIRMISEGSVHTGRVIRMAP